jgi:L-cystine uptake protein TcyP (sodium:dicarboxylate symporter family)
MSSTIATQGLELVAKLFLYVLGLVIASSIMISLDMIALFILKAEPIRFLRSLSEAITLALKLSL